MAAFAGHCPFTTDGRDGHRWTRMRSADPAHHHRGDRSVGGFL